MAKFAPAVTAESLVQGMVTLFSLPDIYQQVERIKLVNSSFYGFQARIDTISRAITVVGVADLKNLVLATSVVDTFNQISSDLVDMNDFWLQSIRCGAIARLLAKQSAVLHSERLFLAGLLSHIGRLILYQKLPELSEKVLKLADYNAALIPSIEQELLGFTFADVGGELIKAWSLPDALYEAIAYQLTPEVALAHRLDAQLLHIASIFSNQLVHDKQSISDLWNTIPVERRSVVLLEEGDLICLLKQSEEDVAQFFDLLMSGKKCY